MKSFTRWVIISLIIAHALTESWQLVWAFWHNADKVFINPFIDKKALPEGLTPLWWTKMFTENLLWVVTYYWFYRITVKVSKKLALGLLVFLFYHFTDCAFFIYNFSQSRGTYLIFLAIDVIAAIILTLPIKEKAPIQDIQNAKYLVK